MASIRITMGGCQDFGVASIIRATGARGSGYGQRVFTIDGPMTVEQVSALLLLLELDPTDDQVTVETDPAVDRSTFDPDPELDLDAWWEEQVWRNRR